MRTKLGKLGIGSRIRFTGRIRYFKEMAGKLCVVLEQVRYNGKIVTDHVWFRGGGYKFKRAGAATKDRVSFLATVQMYVRTKGMDQVQFQVEYGLKDPDEIFVLLKEERKVQNEKDNGIKTYKNEYGIVDVRFDYLNKKVWLTQEEMSIIFGITKNGITKAIRRIEISGVFDLQTQKNHLINNGKRVNLYSSSYIELLENKIKNGSVGKFIEWYTSVFDSKELDNYKIVRFNQDNISLEVRFTNDYETAWLNQNEIATLYGVSRENITTHIANIFAQGELEKVSVGKFFLHTGKDKKTYEVEYYNLDMILSIGYRVNSERGIAFRKWANSVLKDYLIKGYAINEKRITSLGKTVEIQNKMLSMTMDVDYQELSSVISEYTRALDLLDDYDHQQLSKPKGSETIYQLTYEDAIEIIGSMKYGQNSTIFGVEKEEGKLNGILEAVYMNVFGQEAYPSLEDKAAHLLYFLVKDHPFYDGCKRIAATLFLEFLNRNHALSKNGHLIISNDALTAVTLLTAVSNPDEMETIVSVIENILVKK